MGGYCLSEEGSNRRKLSTSREECRLHRDYLGVNENVALGEDWTEVTEKYWVTVDFVTGVY